MKRMAMGLLCLVALAGCRRTDVREFSVEVPGLREADAAEIRGALATFAGVDQAALKFDYAAQRVLVRYDSMMLAKKNVELAIAARGLTANGVTPESVGAKPRR